MIAVKSNIYRHTDKTEAYSKDFSKKILSHSKQTDISIPRLFNQTMKPVSDSE